VEDCVLVVLIEFLVCFCGIWYLAIPLPNNLDKPSSVWQIAEFHPSRLFDGDGDGVKGFGRHFYSIFFILKGKSGLFFELAQQRG
jgi:hypothetical protein